MKELVYGHITFNYQLVSIDAEYSTMIITEFYYGVETKTRRKYFLFGDKITISKPKKVFTIPFNIEDAYYTKAEIRNAIKSRLLHIQREEEISRGEII